GVVEDDLHARADHVVGHALSLFGWCGKDGHDDVLLANGLGQLAVVADDRVADGLADLALVSIEGGGDVEAVVGEDRRARDRLPEAARAEERDVVLALRPEDLADLRDEAVDVVADTPLAELPERGEVAPDLGRVDVRVLAHLLGGDALLAHLLGLGEHPEVLAEPRGDTDGEPLADPPLALSHEPCRRHACNTIPTRPSLLRRDEIARRR